MVSGRSAEVSMQTAERSPSVAIVIPAYRARATLHDVVERSLGVADVVIVVDDACPDRCGDAVDDMGSRVRVLRHPVNRGVGGASKTGIAEAIRLGVDYVVKVDADDQMDVGYVPELVAILERFSDVDLVKGNRFADAATLQTMPLGRLVGNAGLTLLVKFSSGYWTLVDPTNGFIALARRRAARAPAAAPRRPVLLRDRSAVRVRASAPADRGARDAGNLRRRAELAVDRARAAFLSAEARMAVRAPGGAELPHRRAQCRLAVRFDRPSATRVRGRSSADTSGRSRRRPECRARPARSCSRCCCS